MFSTALQPIPTGQSLAVLHQAPDLVHLCKAINKKGIPRAVEHDLMEPAAALEDLDGRKVRPCALKEDDLFGMASFDRASVQHESWFQHRRRFDHNPIAANLLVGELRCQERDENPTAARQALRPPFGSCA